MLTHAPVSSLHGLSLGAPLGCVRSRLVICSDDPARKETNKRTDDKELVWLAAEIVVNWLAWDQAPNASPVVFYRRRRLASSEAHLADGTDLSG